MLATGYTLHTVPPSLNDYLALRRESGLSVKTEAQGFGALSGSWAFRHVTDATGRAVGMGRVVGDGGWYFLIADMATLPQHQGNGIGSTILDDLMREISREAPSGAFVTLTADPPGRRLYESRGFTDVAPEATGMWRVLN